MVLSCPVRLPHDRVFFWFAVDQTGHIAQFHGDIDPGPAPSVYVCKRLYNRLSFEIEGSCFQYGIGGVDYERWHKPDEPLHFESLPLELSQSLLWITAPFAFHDQPVFSESDVSKFGGRVISRDWNDHLITVQFVHPPPILPGDILTVGDADGRARETKGKAAVHSIHENQFELKIVEQRSTRNPIAPGDFVYPIQPKCECVCRPTAR